MALRWCDVDLILGQISVNRSLHHLRDRSLVFRTPKTAKGRRTIALPPSAILVLREHREKQETNMANVRHTIRRRRFSILPDLTEVHYCRIQ